MNHLLLLLLLATPSPLPDASTTRRGAVSTGPQAFSGPKTFDGGVWTSTLNGAALQTAEDTRVFILPGGNDANPCTESLPCATLARAFSLVPRSIGHRFTIFADAGVYQPSLAILERKDFAGGVVEVIGALATIAVDGGSATGTLSAVSNVAPLPVFTSSGQTWVVDSLKGARLRMTSGAAIGNASVVLSNTANALTLINVVSGTVAIGDSYILEQPATVFRGDGGLLEAPVMLRDLRTQALSTINLPDGGSFVTGEVRLSNVRIEQIGTGSRGVSTETFAGRLALIDSQVQGSVNIGVGAAQTQLLAQRSVISARPGQSAFSISQGALLSSLVGPTLWRSDTASAWFVRDAKLVGSWASNQVIDRPASAVTAAMTLSGASIGTSATGAGTGLVIVCPSTSSGGINIEGPRAVPPSNFISTDFTVPVLTVIGCGTGIVAQGWARVALPTSTFTNVTNVLQVTRGAQVLVLNAPTVTGSTTDITVDGTAFTFATLNAASPQVVPTTPNVYGSWVAR